MLKFPDAKGAPNRTMFSTAMMRVMLDYVDENKGENGIFIREKHNDTLLQLKQTIEQKVPAEFNNDVNIDQIKGKLEYFASHASLNHPGSVRNLWRRGSASLDLLKLPSGVYTEKELEPARERRRLSSEKRHPQRASQRKNSGADSEASYSPTEGIPQHERKASRQTNNIAQPEARQPSTSDLARLRAAVSTALVNDSPNTKHVQGAMNDLRNDIEAAVLQRMRDSGISSTQPVALDTELLNCGLRDLTANVLGCDASMIRYELSKLSDLCAQQRLQLDCFVRALVGAAVSLWALEPVSQGPTDPRYKALEKALKDADATAAAILCGQATQQYLDQNFKPQIPDRAYMLADKLDRLLSPFLCPPASAQIFVENAVPVHEPDSRSPSVEAVSLSDEDGQSLQGSNFTDGGLTAPYWITQWKHELREIFKQALHLRVALEIMGGQYRFYFPRPGSRYAAVNQSTRKSVGSVEPDKLVMLGLLPIISGRFQSTPGGSYSDEQIISMSPVFVFDGAKAR